MAEWGVRWERFGLPFKIGLAASPPEGGENEGHSIYQEGVVLRAIEPRRFMYFVMDPRRPAVNLQRAEELGVKVLRVHDTGP